MAVTVGILEVTQEVLGGRHAQVLLDDGVEQRSMGVGNLPPTGALLPLLTPRADELFARAVLEGRPFDPDLWELHRQVQTIRTRLNVIESGVAGSTLLQTQTAVSDLAQFLLVVLRRLVKNS